MTEEDDPRLQPIIDRIPTQWGKYVGVGPGWYEIIIELDKALAEIDPEYEVHQVKTKFGGLRYYCERKSTTFDGDDWKLDPFYTLVTDAERTCDLTDPETGKPIDRS